MLRFLRIERPTIATLRPTCTATSIACCIRCTFDANETTRMRPLRSGISVRNASPTSRSEPVIPGRSAFVESPSSRSTPWLPSSASRPTSVFSPSTGVWSSFQSPGVEDASRRRLEHDRDAVRNRVRHAHEVERERADPDLLVRHRLLQLGRRREAVLVELRLDQPERQLRRDHLVAVDLAQQVRQPADVVLVPVREHDRVDALPLEVARCRAGRGRRRGARRAGTRDPRRR